MNRWTASRVVGITAVLWTIAIVGYLATEAFRLLESGSGLVAVTSTLVALTALYFGPLLLVLPLLLVRRGRGSGYAA